MLVEVTDGWDNLKEAMNAADARVEPWQREVKPGDIVMVFAGTAQEGVLSFCRVRSMVGSPGCENYREAMVYSIYVPYGEIEDIHVSSVVAVLTEEQFREAKEEGWSPAVCKQWRDDGRLVV